METRSGRRHLSPRRGRNVGRADSADHISGLHDDMLIQVLSRLRCAAAAARASALSRRWRDGALWRHLSELSFRGVAHGALEAALARVALPKLSLLDIEVTDRVPAEAVASLLRAAARLDPVEVSIVISWVIRNDESAAVEVPSFPRATSITLRLHNLDLTLPAAQAGAAGEFQFPVLERLSISSGRFDSGALISQCPKLRVLELIYCWGIETVKVHSATMEELLVISELLIGADIVVPMLKKFTLRSDVHVDFGMKLLAPAVENLSWKCWSNGQSIAPAMALAVGIKPLWRLVLLELGTMTEWNGFVLSLDIARSYSVLNLRNLQEMFPLPKVSVLELCIDTRGHVYGGVVVDLLRIWSAIRRLKLDIGRDTSKEEVCLPDCPCDQPQNWRSQNISLMGLEVVEIQNFKGRDHEVDFLKFLFRCAPLTTKVTMKLASKVDPRNRGCKEAFNIFKANPAVECKVYLKSGSKVTYVRASRSSQRRGISSCSTLSSDDSRIGRWW